MDARMLDLRRRGVPDRWMREQGGRGAHVACAPTAFRATRRGTLTDEDIYDDTGRDVTPGPRGRECVRARKREMGVLSSS